MNIDPISLAIGIVAGMAAAFLFRLHALRRLDLNLEKLGVALGVEGFQEEQPSPSVQIGDVGGSITGDVAGGDINKNSHFYKAAEAAARDAVTTDRSRTRILRSRTMTSRTDDPETIARLQSVSSSGGDWLDSYVAEYIQCQDFRRDLAEAKGQARALGWHIVSASPVDNISNGLMLSLTLERDAPE